MFVLTLLAANFGGDRQNRTVARPRRAQRGKSFLFGYPPRIALRDVRRGASLVQIQAETGPSGTGNTLCAQSVGALRHFFLVPSEAAKAFSTLKKFCVAAPYAWSIESIQRQGPLCMPIGVACRAA